jgi:hypothetical protein
MVATSLPTLFRRLPQAANSRCLGCLRYPQRPASVAAPASGHCERRSRFARRLRDKHRPGCIVGAIALDIHDPSHGAIPMGTKR